MNEVKTVAGLSYREAVPEGWTGSGRVALLLHGWPNSSYMWRNVTAALASTGCRALAPDLPGFGDSPPVRPGTWERHAGAIERFRRKLGLERVALVAHDWGVLIGLRWASEHPEAVSALVISNGASVLTEGKWHPVAQIMRTEGEGERFMDSLTRELFDAAVMQDSPGTTPDALDEYWKSLSDEVRRNAVLDLYRSGDFQTLAPYETELASLGVPTLFLWGAKDERARLTLARRFHENVPGSELVVLDAGHCIFDDEPATAARAVAEFLASAAT